LATVTFSFKCGRGPKFYPRLSTASTERMNT
jgi:hypothetical protein